MTSTRFEKGRGFIDLVGNKYSKLIVLEYVGADKHKRSKWKCLCDCGQECEAFGTELKQEKTRSCGCDRKYQPRPKLTQESFIKRSQTAHNFKYTYERVNFVNVSTKVEINCPSHGYFDQRPTMHLKGQGCAKCAWEEKVRNRKVTQTEFEERGIKLYNNEHDYSITKFVETKGKVNIWCKVCEKVFVKHAHSYLCGSGCPKCSLKKRSEDCTMSKEEYLVTLVGKFEDGEYDYSNMIYNGSKKYLEIHCNTCNSKFELRSDVHQAGTGCPCKSTRGFSFAKPGYLYILEETSENLIKIGITSHPIGKRIKDINSDSCHNFHLVRDYYFENPRHCSNVETLLLRELRINYRNPSEKFDGYTECFFSVCKEEVESLVEYYKGDVCGR